MKKCREMVKWREIIKWWDMIKCVPSAPCHVSLLLQERRDSLAPRGEQFHSEPGEAQIEIQVEPG